MQSWADGHYVWIGWSMLPSLTAQAQVGSSAWGRWCWREGREVKELSCALTCPSRGDGHGQVSNLHTGTRKHSLEWEKAVWFIYSELFIPV